MHMYIFTLVNWQYFTPEISEIRAIPGISPTKKAAFWATSCDVTTKNFRYLKWRNPEPCEPAILGWGNSRIHKLYIQLTKVRIPPF